MKNSKIKTIVSIKPHQTERFGTTFYHNLEMENGDKINIGKKKEQKEGWELSYEIIEQGQQEYNKAKAVAPNNFNKSNNYTSSNSNKNHDTQLTIVRQSSITRAIEFMNLMNLINPVKYTREQLRQIIFEEAECNEKWVMRSDVQNKVDMIKKSFDAEVKNDDTPF